MWLSGWAKRISITIAGADVPESETNYPHLVLISSSSGKTDVDLTAVFDELGANNLKLAIADDTNTECYVEVATWDTVNEIGELWAKINPSTSGNTYYLYFDSTHADNSTYVGVTGSTPAQAVWDSNFVFVSHMNDNPDTSHIKDSTSNANNGTKKGINEPIEATRSVGKAQSFDGSNDMVALTSVSGVDIIDRPLTLEATIQPITGAGDGYIICRNTDAAANLQYALQWSSNIVFNYLEGTGHRTDSNANVTVNSWYVLAFVWNNVGVTQHYVSGSPSGSPNSYTGALTSRTTLQLGRRALANLYFKGLIDEVRISNIARSADWISLTNKSLTDALNTFGGVNNLYTETGHEQVILASQGSSVSQTANERGHIVEIKAKTGHRDNAEFFERREQIILAKIGGNAVIPYDETGKLQVMLAKIGGADFKISAIKRGGVNRGFTSKHSRGQQQEHTRPSYSGRSRP